ncbi:olfactory receptor 52N1-like [Macrochelys suwanniensis]
MYIIAILGNFTILFIVKMEPSLHVPMYYFLCMLAITDLVRSTSTVPKTLSICWFNSTAIDFSACLTQLHSTILTNLMVAKIHLAMVLYGAMLVLPFPFLARRWPCCRTSIIPHMQCEHMAVLKLACADIRISSHYSLSVALSVMALHVYFIAMSYTQSLGAIFSLLTRDARLKTFGTCIFHLCAILVSYIPALFSSLTHRFGNNVALHFHVLMANAYLLMPPMLHPVIYGVRTKQIRDRFLQLFTHKGT